MCPPVMLLCAQVEMATLKRQAREFHAVLLQNGVYVDSNVYPDTTHSSIILNWHSHNRQVLLDIVMFIDRAIYARRRVLI